ncbi:magnesium-translocating P-type ATPase [Candidatus Methanoperedens nitroreducens]|uniref:Magnesium-transporting ATPase, P-type 1 n=1 Tax=Candidatus Methanoperedens nitratireducens TaxID=1392998 RepID=A0A062V5C7_9EURY|nr:magnesium-translocating P-type ATPase [Candidatus Methanoperedens nitroreducens]KCZ72517.1 magnesium-translocating P-type ATPase [Candidatus Methanoperedens nitroreducens]MDJ1423549.1 magnesium-translocating P-type ATPase [Candidatus Methanoperedens sp.]
MNQHRLAFWSIQASELLQRLQTTQEGLTSDEAQQRLIRYGPNLLTPRKRIDALMLLLAQFKSPIILILIFAVILSFFLGDPVDTIIILIIIFISGLLGFWQEWGAANVVERLISTVRVNATVLRDRDRKEIPVGDVVPGDIVLLAAGDGIPGDCLILESRDLFINEAALTGETYPVEKVPGVLPKEKPLGQRTNSLFMGTHVVSGTAKAMVLYTGAETEFGKVFKHLEFRPPETEFEHGVRRFGYFLIEVTLLLVITIFAINAYLARPILESFLFALALAVGLTPQLLPAIISVNLAHGAKRMARQKVIVKRLASIENFGSMNVLCSDKTGTLTEGVMRIQAALDVDGNQSEKVLLYAYLNAIYESGFVNPIDKAIRAHRTFDLSAYRKLDEVPYDFIRKRLSILVSKEDTHIMVTKGALHNVLVLCTSAEISRGIIVDIDVAREQILQRFERLSGEGFRVLGIAYRDIGSISIITKDYEAGMTFLGFIVFYDPPKSGVAEAIDHLRHLGVSLKIITGDNRLVAASVSKQVGLSDPQILTGHDLRLMSDEALLRQVNYINIFAEIEPNQKERIILALRRAGNVVGYMGDGINDAPALHVADAGISVDSAVDVAKDAADIVLLEKDLSVLAQGVREGRVTFANTLKYVFMATSANFGNMFSMAGASLFLPFLPLLPKQILLNNLMTDFPEMTIATDSVDNEMVDRPRRWNIRFIRTFMIIFGILSSVFDYLTFGALLLILHATVDQFRTGWFIESVISASMIILVIRTRRPFFKSMPGKYLLTATLLIIVGTSLLPFTPLKKIFEFSPLSVSFFLIMWMIVVFYIIAAERIKEAFYKRVEF